MDTTAVPVADLRQVSDLQGLPDATFEWLAEHGEYVELAVGEKAFKPGEPADKMAILLDGAIQLIRMEGGRNCSSTPFEGAASRPCSRIRA